MKGYFKRRKELREAVADVDDIAQRDDPYEYWDHEHSGSLGAFRKDARAHYGRLASEGDPELIESLRRDAALYAQDGDDDAAKKYLRLATIAERNAERKAEKSTRKGCRLRW